MQTRLFPRVGANDPNGSAGEETSVPPAAAPPPNPKALDTHDILDLLKNFVPGAHVAHRASRYGRKFAPRQDDLRDIRNDGGTDDLPDGIRESAKKQ